MERAGGNMSSQLLERMGSFIRENNLIPENARVGAAVSGGADSMAMLYALRELGYAVYALHFEHGIRPRVESEGDMRFVESYCAKNGIPFYCEQGQVLCHAQRGESVETAARRLRYDFLARMAQAHDLDLIATAHHADDAVESFFLHLLRGSGMRGLTGMPPKREPNLIRPMLFARRQEIEEFCRENEIPFVTDATNLSADYTRNYLRLEVLPGLETVNPQYAQAILRTQEILSEEDAALEAYLERELAKTAVFEKDRVVIGLEPFRKLPTGIQRRMLRRCIAAVSSPEDLEKKHLDALMKLCGSGRTGAEFTLPKKFSAIVSYNSLIIAKKMYKIKRMEEYPLCTRGRTVLREGAEMLCAPAEQAVFGNGADPVQYLNGTALAGAVVRTRRQGDLFHALGAGGSKKLKDWMIDRKIPAALRDEIPLVARGNRVLWVVGYAISEDAKLSGACSIVKCEYIIKR